MRTYKKVVLALLAVGALGASAVAIADDHRRGYGPDGFGHGGFGGVGAMGGMRGMGAMMAFETFDQDGDGQVTQNEIDAALSERLGAADQSGDDAVSLEEFQAIWGEVTQRPRVRTFQFLDVDGSGTVTLAEMQRPLDRVLARLDRNDDGAITADELERRGRGRGPGFGRGGRDRDDDDDDDD